MLKLNTIMIGSDDPQKLVDFYAKVLGEPQWRDTVYTGWSLGGPFFMIGPHSDVRGRNSEPARVIWNLETGDVQSEVARIKDTGAKVVQDLYQPAADQAPDFWMATFEDVDGNYFQVTAPPPAGM